MNGLEELHMWILLIFVIYLFNYDKYLTWSTFYVPGIVIALCVLTQIFTTTVFDTLVITVLQVKKLRHGKIK